MPNNPSQAGWSWRRALVFLTPIAAGAFTFYTLAALSDASKDLSAGHEVDKRVEALLSTLKDAETGQRGFLLTTDRAYLRPYAAALAALPLDTAAVTDSIGSNHPDLLGSLVDLQHLIDEKTTELARTIALAEQGQHSAALGLVRENLGKQTMDAIRALVVRIQADIDVDFSAAAARMRKLETSAAVALWLTLAGTLFLIAMLRRTQSVATRARFMLEQEAARRSASEADREHALELEFEARGDAEAAVGRRRAAEENLTVSELNLSAALASIGAGFIATDREGRVTRMNAVAEQITGWSQTDGCGRILWEVFDREDLPAKPTLANPLELMAGQGMTVQDIQRVVVISRGGVRSELEVQSAVTQRDDGSPLGAAMVFRNVTREVRAEAESSRLAAIVESSSDAVVGKTLARDVTRRREAEAALHVSEARLRFALEAAQIGNWDLDLSTGQAQCSLRHFRCFGYETPQADWTFARFEQHVHPRDRVEVVRTFRAAVAERADWGLECRVIWPDASVHWIRVHGSRHEEGDGASHMLGIVMDISEHKQAEEARSRLRQLESENRQIQAATLLKSQFLANMSHELRTPLNAIIGFADLLHSGAVEGDPVKERLFVGHICTSGRHLLQLINDVLDLAKVESGKFEFFPEPVDLAALIQEVADILQTSLLQKDIRLAVEIAPTLGQVIVDAARLKQALYNYLSNAIKFSADGGQIQVRAAADGSTRFRIEVEDSGIGIAAADVPTLFSDFQQLDAGLSKLHQGTGLGLALTRRIVRAQGGDVGVRSTLGQGSTFYLVLDRLHARNANAPGALRSGRPAGVVPALEDAT